MIAGTARQRVPSSEVSEKLNKWRWIAVSVFVLSNALNFLDRQLLSAVAPMIRAEFHLSNAQYGQVLGAFALVYAVTAPFAGAFIDRVGLLGGAVASVLIWSLSSALTGWTHSFRALLGTRMGLGFGEAGALPCSSKAAANYLSPSEWGLASAAGAIAVTIGSVSAPLLVAFMVPKYGWRSVFLVSGVLGAVWILLWMLTARKVRPAFEPRRRVGWPVMKTLGDRRLWALAFSYAFVMALYMFWLGWTTVYLVGERKLTPIEANQFFAWIPPVFATVGGFLSGGLAFRWIRRGQNCFHARMRIAWWSAPLVLVTAAVPWVASTRLAVLLIGLSLLFCMSVITSLNIIPVDLFGRENAGFTVAILASAYAFMQAVISPLIGSVVDRYGFAAVCVTLSVFPTLGVWVLHVFTKQRGALVSPDAADLGGVS